MSVQTGEVTTQCAKCGTTTDFQRLACGHFMCQPCDQAMVTFQQRHDGLEMHSFDITCVAKIRKEDEKEEATTPCTGLYFANTHLDTLPQDKFISIDLRPSEPLGNFFEGAPIQVEGEVYPTLEHYMQCAKYFLPRAAAGGAGADPFSAAQREVNAALVELVRNAETAHQAHVTAWSFARKSAADTRVTPIMRPDWDAVKLDVLHLGLVTKTLQHDSVRARLAETQDLEIVVGDTDFFWGTNPLMGVMQGRNALGQAWMRVRTEIAAGKKEESEE